MQTYLMTRGTARANDYQFIGNEPAQRWWAPVAEHVVLEEAELIVAADDGRLGILLSGLPSQRHDVIGTALRYTVVVDDVAAEPELVRRLVAAGLSEAGRELLGELLDKPFGGSAVDEFIHGADPASVPELVNTALRDLPEAPPGAATEDGPASWVGPLESPQARELFRRRVDRLIERGTGYAFTSHLLSTARGAESAREGVPVDIAVLLVDGTVPRVTALGKGRRPGTQDEPELQPLLVLATAGLAVLGALGWIIWWAARRLL